MKKMSLHQMATIEGGKLTSQEIDDFLGAGGCTLAFFGGLAGAVFGGGACIRWLQSL